MCSEFIAPADGRRLYPLIAAYFAWARCKYKDIEHLHNGFLGALATKWTNV